ncbi:MAG: hypothetical protein H0T89_03210 [Deltaproteobacteria bacterium]|nr:hypothetical protein [Deltaproteobacteria bacterium]MDQ3301032.1 BatD family protein [Myxococcota bacterium]
MRGPQLAILLACSLVASVAAAQSGSAGAAADPMPPEVDAGVVDPATGSATGSASGSAGSADPNVGSGSPNGGWADPNAGSAGSGSAGSADPNAGSAGSGPGSGAIILQLPTDIAAPQVTAAADPTVVRLGGKFTVVIRATYGDGVEVNLREPVELGSVFEVRRKLSEDRKVTGGRVTREWQIEVIAWELGDLVMPPISVTYTAFGKAGQVETNRIRLKIIGVLGDLVDDPKAMRGHAPPAELIVRDWFWLWVGAAAGAVLGVAIALVLYRRHRRRRASLVPGAVMRPRRMSRMADMTSERALQRLLAIEESGVLDREDDRRTGYAEMVEVIRDYVGARYRIATSELTSSELLRRLERAAPDDERLLVERWLAGCDLVKYGGLRTTGDQARATLDDARALIVATTSHGKPAAVPVGRAA